MRILVVEDEAITALLMTAMLKNMGHEVVKCCATGEEAIKSTVEFQPDVIFMDILLAGEINGIEAAIQIKEKLDIPIIFCTGYDDDETKNNAKQVNYHAFLIKPLIKNDIKAALDSLFL